MHQNVEPLRAPGGEGLPQEKAGPRSPCPRPPGPRAACQEKHEKEGLFKKPEPNLSAAQTGSTAAWPRSILISTAWDRRCSFLFLTSSICSAAVVKFCLCFSLPLLFGALGTPTRGILQAPLQQGAPSKGAAGGEAAETGALPAKSPSLLASLFSTPGAAVLQPGSIKSVEPKFPLPSKEREADEHFRKPRQPRHLWLKSEGILLTVCLRLQRLPGSRLFFCFGLSKRSSSRRDVPSWLHKANPDGVWAVLQQK